MTRKILCIHSEYASKYRAYDPLSSCEHVWVEKDLAETDPSFRQIIPYVAVVKRGTSQLLVYDRHGDEKRLHGLSSIGIGGHVDYPESWQDGMFRELREEAGITKPNIYNLGRIIRNDTPVDQVHLGLAFMAIVDEANPQAELLNPRWEHAQDIDRTTLESWSVDLLNLLLEQRRMGS